VLNFPQKRFHSHFKCVIYTYRLKYIPFALLPRARLMQPTTQQEFTMPINLILAACVPVCPDRKLGPVFHQIGGLVRSSFLSGQWLERYD